MKTFKKTYGLDQIALVPTNKTIDPDLVDINVKLGNISLKVPIIASAMDSVVDTKTAVSLTKSGALGILNLEGLQTRYENVDEILKDIAKIDNTDYISKMQELYKEPVKPELVKKRILEIKNANGIAFVSSTPANANFLGEIAEQAGADGFLVQSTVVAHEHETNKLETKLDLKAFCKKMSIPVLVGNTTTYESAISLMRLGVKGVFIGIGPGAACTTRGVLGIGVPMATAISDAANARNDYFKETGEYVPVIADGGIINSGDICKSLCIGADAVMIGSPLARAKSAPGNGYHWGMATPDKLLPRGARIKVEQQASLEQILFGPSNCDNGTQNLFGAIVTCMATLGTKTIKELHENVQVIIAPSLQTEGKAYQEKQNIGMKKK